MSGLQEAIEAVCERSERLLAALEAGDADTAAGLAEERGRALEALAAIGAGPGPGPSSHPLFRRALALDVELAERAAESRDAAARALAGERRLRSAVQSLRGPGRRAPHFVSRRA